MTPPSLRRAPLWLGVLVALAIPASAAGDSTLAGQWHMNEVSSGGLTPDSSGNDNHAFTNHPILEDGKFGKTLNTDNSVIRVPGPAAALEAPHVTVLAWVKSPTVPSPFSYVLGKGADACTGASYAMYTGTSGDGDGRLRFYVDDGPGFTRSPAAPASIWDGQWHAVAGTFDGTTVRLYVDGAQVGGGTPSSGAAVDYGASNHDFHIASYSNETNGSCPFQTYWTRGVDEVRVYNGALTPAEIQTVSTGAALPPPGSPPGPPGPPESGDPPGNVQRPKIVADPSAPGTYRCETGQWTRLAAPPVFRFSWANTTFGHAASGAQTFHPAPTDYGALFVCAVSTSNAFGTGVALSDSVFFTSAGLNTLPPAYGNVRIRGIDVFQVVQPNSAAAQFGFPAGAFPSIPGGGTPTSYRPAAAGGLTSPLPQQATYQGVTLDSLKPTTATVYVDVAGAPPTDPNVPLELTLVAKRHGGYVGELTRQISNLSASSTPVVTQAERNNKSFGFQFELPANWTRSDFTLEAHVTFPPATLGEAYGRRECDNRCVADNDFKLDAVRVAELPQLLVESVQLLQGSQTSLGAPGDVAAAARALFPGGDRMTVYPYRQTLDITTEVGLTATAVTGTSNFTCNKLTYSPPITTVALATRLCRMAGIATRLRGWEAANPAREITFLPLTNLPFRITERYDILFAVHNYSLPSGNPEPGWQNDGDITGVTATSPVTGGPFVAITSRTRPVTAAAHEFGHALSAPHADIAGGCGGNQNGQVGEPWPTDNTGRLQGTKFFDGTPTVDGVGATLFDLMSYCADLADTSLASPGDAWISPFNWNRFFARLRSFGGRVGFGPRPRTISAVGARAASPRATSTGLALAYGAVGTEGGRIERIVPPDRALAVPASDPASAVHLRSLDAAGRVLLDAGVSVSPLTDVPAAAGGTFTGPVAARAAVVELVRDGAVVDRRARSRAPRVRLSTPTARTRVGGGRASALVVRWSASDPDGDPLSATVEYSSDDGRNWRTLFDGTDRGSARLPGRYLEGSRQARVRLRVSDGFAEGSATSARFRADGTPPTARILSPRSGDRIVAGDVVALAATAFDDRHVALGGSALTWFAGRRRLGTGNALGVRLHPGRVTLRLAARDRTGRRVVRSLAVRVEARRQRLVTFAFPRVVRAGARTVTGRIATAAAATFAAAGRRYAVGPRARRVVLALPRRPRAGLLRVAFTLTPRARDVAGRVRGIIEVVRP